MIKVYNNEADTWKFREIDGIEERSFNKLLETFLSYGLNALIRENIQNSLDAKLTSEKPVKITINLGDLETNDIPGIDTIRQRINCLEGANDYDRKTIRHMQSIIQLESTKFMSFEDENTKGLNSTNWDFYAYQKGAHYTESDANLENIRGGSHGVGKIASNAASDIHLMFFSNCDEQSIQQIGGTIQLVEHNFNNKTFRSTGYYTDIATDCAFTPYNNTFDPSHVFAKKTRGLKIIIPFFKYETNATKEIIRAVCDNFFHAILQGQLIVNVLQLEINKDTIFNIINDENIYPSDDNTNFTTNYVHTYLNAKPIDLAINDLKNQHIFDLYFRYDESIKRGKVAVIRTIGMKIEDFKVSGHSKTPFNAVLIPKTQSEDVFLKSLENESHTKLTFENIRDVSEQKNAKRFINNLNKALATHISEILKKENPTDGEINTADLLYSVENKFQQIIEQHTPTILISEPNTNNESLVVKTTPPPTPRNRNPEPKPPTPRPKPSVNPKPPKPRKNTEYTEFFSLQPEQVKRLVLSGGEHLLFNLLNCENYDNQKKCNICLKYVDGQGNINDELININKYYITAINSKTKKQYTIFNNKILDVDIVKGQVALDLQLNQNSNKLLKFIYFLEV